MVGELAEIFVRLVGGLVTAKSDMSDFCGRAHCEYAVDHAETCAQDRQNGELFARKDRLHRFSDGGLDLDKLGGQVAQSLVSH